jgi:hypothetical protein
VLVAKGGQILLHKGFGFADLGLETPAKDETVCIGQHGSLLGYSGSLYDFPEDQLTIVVLTDTEGQNVYAITRTLASAILGLPALSSPAPAIEQKLADKPVSDGEVVRLAGTFVLKLAQVSGNLHDSFSQTLKSHSSCRMIARLP